MARMLYVPFLVYPLSLFPIGAPTFWTVHKLSPINKLRKAQLAVVVKGDVLDAIQEVIDHSVYEWHIELHSTARQGNRG